MIFISTSVSSFFINVSSFKSFFHPRFLRIADISINSPQIFAILSSILSGRIKIIIAWFNKPRRDFPMDPEWSIQSESLSSRERKKFGFKNTQRVEQPRMKNRTTRYRCLRIQIPHVGTLLVCRLFFCMVLIGKKITTIWRFPFDEKN